MRTQQGGQARLIHNPIAGSVSRRCHVLQVFRATNGKALVWGKPPKKIVAKYITGDGRQKTSLLLASGESSSVSKMIRLAACRLMCSKIAHVRIAACGDR